MRIMFVGTNNFPYRYDQPNKPGWNLIPSLLAKKGVIVKGIGKYELHKFYHEYLKFKPDLIETSWVPATCIPIIFRKLGLVKCPVVHRWDDYYADMQTNYPRWIVKLLEDFTVKNCDFSITVSRYNAEKGRKLGKNSVYLPHGYFPGASKTKINLKKLKTKKKNITLIYLGDQNPWKKVDQIIRAVEGLDCDLFLFGRTNPDFQKIAGKNVHFMGYVPESEVQSILKQADVLVNTSDQDCNFKLFEYICAGRPILGYDGRAAFVLANRENALLTRNFREGVNELIEKPELLKKLEKNIKKLKVLSWDETADKILSYYKNWASKR